MRLRAVLLSALSLPLLAALPAAASGCSLARAQRGANPGHAQVSAELDRAANRRQVPPPLLKAIAWKESGWAQFWPDGRAKVSGDCGVGIMQVTGGNWDYRRLATDFRYNIDAGARILAAKMSTSSANVPAGLGPDDRRVFENWYRAAYRYNGAGYRAERYADSVFALVNQGLMPYAPPVRVTNPKAVLRGYSPTSGHAYVVRPDGVWRSTLGARRGPFQRADLLAYAPRMVGGRTLEGDQQVYATFTARNLGYATWTPASLPLAPYPVGRASLLRSPLWADARTAARLTTSVPTGATGRWTVHVQAARLAAARGVDEFFAPLGTRAAAPSRWTLHPPVAPTASVAGLPEYVTEAAVDASAVVTVSAADPGTGAAGVRRVEVIQRPAGCADCAWSVPATTTGRSLRLRFGAPGAHEVRVRAVDNAGHASPWTAERRVIVPRDDTAAELVWDAAWSERSGEAGAWLGSLHVADQRGASVQAVLDGGRFAVIGTRAPEAAPFRVLLDGVVVAEVDPTAPAAAYRQVLVEVDAEPGSHVVRVEVLADGRTLAVDAIAAV